MTNAKTYGDYTIALRESDWQFEISGGGNEFDRQTFASYRGATAEIDQLAQTKYAQAKASVSIKLPIVYEDEAPHFKVGFTAITGIHAARGHLLFADKKEHRDVWADSPRVRGLVEELAALRRREVEINGELRGTGLSGRYFYGRSGTEKYLESIEKLKTDYATAATAATKEKTNV